MFECLDRESSDVIKVYGIDFVHGAFLIECDGRFKLVDWNKFIPLG